MTVARANLLKHIENMRAFGVEPVVVVNRFPGDTVDGLRKILDFCDANDVRAASYEAYEKGPAGASELAAIVDAAIADNQRSNAFDFLYPIEAPIRDKIDTVARIVYGADGVDYD